MNERRKGKETFPNLLRSILCENRLHQPLLPAVPLNNLMSTSPRGALALSSHPSFTVLAHLAYFPSVELGFGRIRLRSEERRELGAVPQGADRRGFEINYARDFRRVFGVNEDVIHAQIVQEQRKRRKLRIRRIQPKPNGHILDKPVHISLTRLDSSEIMRNEERSPLRSSIIRIEIIIFLGRGLGFLRTLVIGAYGRALRFWGEMRPMGVSDPALGLFLHPIDLALGASFDVSRLGWPRAAIEMRVFTPAFAEKWPADHGSDDVASVVVLVKRSRLLESVGEEGYEERGEVLKECVLGLDRHVRVEVGKRFTRGLRHEDVFAAELVIWI